MIVIGQRLQLPLQSREAELLPQLETSGKEMVQVLHQ
jgi:hypothetical protein